MMIAYRQRRGGVTTAWTEQFDTGAEVHGGQEGRSDELSGKQKPGSS
jgi:hypothetical protein